MGRWLLIFAFFYCFSLSGQGFRSRFYLPGAINNSARAIYETSPGNSLAMGFIADTTAGHTRLAMMGLNAQGQLQWTKLYGAANPEYVNNPFISRMFYRLGNYVYFAGCAKENGKQIGVFVKFDLNGDTLWQKFYRIEDPKDLVPQMVTASVDGGFLITGFSQNWGSDGGGTLLLLIKTDANGNELWRKRIGKPEPNVQDGKAIIQDIASKKIVIVGYQYLSGGYGNYDNIVILDSLGNKINQHVYVNGLAQDILQSKDKKIILCGFVISKDAQETEYSQGYVMKFDLNNLVTPVWKVVIEKNYFTSGFTCLRQLDNGNVLIGGWLDSLDTFPANTLNGIWQITNDGSLKSFRRYNYKANKLTNDNYLGMRSLELTSNGGYLGAIQYFNQPLPNPFLFVKYDSTGCDTTVEYCQYLASLDIEENIKAGVNVRVYPNPASDVIKIETSSLDLEGLSFRISNSLGRELKVYAISEEGRQGTFSIDLNHLDRGLYFLSIYTKGERISTQKIFRE